MWLQALEELGLDAVDLVDDDTVTIFESVAQESNGSFPESSTSNRMAVDGTLKFSLTTTTISID